MILLEQMFILFLLMMVGMIGRKKGLINDVVCKGMSAIVLNIACPAFVLSAGINKDEYVSNEALLTCAICAVAIYAGLILMAVIIPYILRLPKDNYGTYRVMTIFSNIGFMGFPIVSATYGSIGLLYAATFQFPFNLLFYTYGIKTMQSSSDTQTESESSWKNILNVGVISVFISIALYLLRVHVPESLADAISSLSGLTVPLSMMVIGYSLGGMKIRSLLSDYRLLFFAFIKLILIPIIGISLLKLFITDETLLGVCFIMIATPVGSMTAMLAQCYGGDEDTASRGVALTTLLSVVTIPLVGGLCL
jgi:predicted permease